MPGPGPVTTYDIFESHARMRAMPPSARPLSEGRKPTRLQIHAGRKMSGRMGAEAALPRQIKTSES
jgi:hypothetical protein